MVWQFLEIRKPVIKLGLLNLLSFCFISINNFRIIKPVLLKLYIYCFYLIVTKGKKTCNNITLCKMFKYLYIKNNIFWINWTSKYISKQDYNYIFSEAIMLFKLMVIFFVYSGTHYCLHPCLAQSLTWYPHHLTGKDCK